MPKRKKLAPDAAELSRAVARFGGRDIRGGVIMATAWVDDALEACLENYFSRNPTIAKDLLRSDGPLGSFAARIKMSFLLGLISESVRHDLDIIRAIRNDFAHVRERVSFSERSVKDRCNELNIYRLYASKSRGSYRTAQNQFVMSTYLLTAALIELAKRTTPPDDASSFVTTWIDGVCEAASAALSNAEAFVE